MLANVKIVNDQRNKSCSPTMAEAAAVGGGMASVCAKSYDALRRRGEWRSRRSICTLELPRMP